MTPDITRRRWSALDFEQRRQILRRPALERRDDVEKDVRDIIAQVRADGDAALRRLTQRLDRISLECFEVSPAEFQAAERALSPDKMAALSLAAERIEAFHRPQLPVRMEIEVAPGVRLAREPRPISGVGLYAPGGTAPLPSTVLMLGIPSRIARCPLRILCTPPGPDGALSPAILAAAKLCGIERVFKLGGAQAVAAMAYGSESVPKVDKIFGPGNAWVTAAKSLVSQDPEGAAIDMPAGPSEVLVIADSAANASFVASDLLSQAEHGRDSQVVLVATDAGLMDKVLEETARQLEKLSRREIAEASLAKSLFIQARDLDEALEISNAYAPEHLILQTRDPASLAAKIQNAGSVFLGPWSPESAGDYASGTNHVLPTYGFARSCGGVSVETFMKQITFQELSREGLRALGPVVETLAAMEGLDAHRNAVSIRLKEIARG